MSNYLEILQLFVSHSGDADSPVRFPTIYADFAAATDRNALVFFPADLLPKGTTFPVQERRFPDFSQFLELAEDCETEIDLEKLKALVDLCPMEEDFDENQAETGCDECEGYGEVRFTYEDSHGGDHEIDAECPICDGEGKVRELALTPNGKMIRSRDYYLQLGDAFLAIWLAEKLLKVQELVGGELLLVNEGIGNLSARVFEIGSVRVVIQPLLTNGLVSLGSL